MAWSKLVDLALTDEEKLDACMPCMPSKGPRYPYGTCISLTDKELAKLKLPVPENGAVIDMRVFGVVTGVSTNDGPDGETCRVEIQIQRMAVENEATEDTGAGGEAGEPAAKPRSRLYREKA